MFFIKFIHYYLISLFIRIIKSEVISEFTFPRKTFFLSIKILIEFFSIKFWINGLINLNRFGSNYLPKSYDQNIYNITKADFYVISYETILLTNNNVPDNYINEIPLLYEKLGNEINKLKLQVKLIK